MSNTRHAEDDSFHQERFCSEFCRGLLANIVAKKCDLVSSREDRQLIWSLQLLSHSEGGLEDLATRLVEVRRDEIVRQKSPAVESREALHEQAVIAARLRSLSGEHREPPAPLPAHNPIVNLDAAKRALPALLGRLCTDPATSEEEWRPWFLPSMRGALTAYIQQRSEARRRGLVTTEVGRQVNEELDYALHSRCMVLVEGPSRIGKSYAAKAWCEARPGVARYVQCPSTSDSIGFFRRIADAIGSASALSMKTVQIRERIESALQGSGLMLVIDEAHYAWPQSGRRQSPPDRINWINTALINFGVPVALIATPQFSRDLKEVEKKAGWTSEQFYGRLGHYTKLPEKLSDEDLRAVARYYLPNGPAKAIPALALYAELSAKYLAAIETTVKRATYLASQAGRSEVTLDDVKAAINENRPAPPATMQEKTAESRAQSSRAVQPIVDLEGAIRTT
jgi:hypothetical protein